MVNYLFPLTDKSPAPSRLSAPDSRQAERDNVTRELGTRASPADGPGTAPAQALAPWLGVPAWVLTLSQDTLFFFWSLFLHLSSPAVSSFRKQLPPSPATMRSLVRPKLPVVLSPCLSRVNSAISLPSPLTRELIMIAPNASPVFAAPNNQFAFESVLLSNTIICHICCPFSISSAAAWVQPLSLSL